MAQTAKFRFSKTISAMKSRIRRLPALVNDAMNAQIKKDAASVIVEYKKGIKRNNFRLEKLQSTTIKQKKSKGLVKPNAPLYGEGENKKNSLINALALRKIKNGWKLVRRRAKHHTANLPLNVLLAIHENGALIKRGNIVIRIPPRPVVDKAIIRALKKKKKGEPTISVRKAINQLILTGKDNLLKKLIEEKGVEFET